MSEGYFRPDYLDEQNVILKKQHYAGPVVAGLINFKCYKEVHTANYVLKTYGGDDCVSFDEKHIALVKNIVSDGEYIHVIVKRFKKLEPAFNDPLVSPDISIYMLSYLDDSTVVYQLHDVRRKCVLLPIKDGCKWIGIPLLHTT